MLFRNAKRIPFSYSLIDFQRFIFGKSIALILFLCRYFYKVYYIYIVYYFVYIICRIVVEGSAPTSLQEVKNIETSS